MDFVRMHLPVGGGVERPWGQGCAGSSGGKEECGRFGNQREDLSMWRKRGSTGRAEGVGSTW